MLVSILSFVVPTDNLVTITTIKLSAAPATSKKTGLIHIDRRQ
jgi:hypothetical protein